MKVLLLNGSPHEHGCTYTALKEAADEFNKLGVDTEFFWIGNRPVGGCIGCRACAKSGKCVFDGGVNEFVEKMRACDGLIVGSPVHYAAACGNVTSLLDRAFFSGKNAFYLKTAAAVVSCRRGGATAAFDQLNKYFTIANMIVIGSQYWNMIHGNTAEEAAKDAEGLQTMRTLARNTAFVLKCIDGKEKPVQEATISTNFIR